MDNVTHTSFEEAHAWLSGSKVRKWAGGVPFKVVCSFLRRHVGGSYEAVPEEPSNAKWWKVETGKQMQVGAMLVTGARK